MTTAEAPAYRPIDVAAVYVATFAGRDDVYSPWTGEQWIAVRKPLTPEVVLEAFRTRRPVAGYLLTAESTTHILAYDFDLEDGWELGRRVAKAMWRAGVPAYVERSRRGCHVWAVVDARIPGVVARRALRTFLADAGVAENPKIELRPGQDRLSGPDGLGHALRLPTMPHGLTGVRHPLCMPDGKPVADSLSGMLLAITWAPASAVLDAAERYVPVVDPRAIPAAYRRPRKYDDADDDVGPILASIGAPFRPGHAIRCPFHDDHNPSLSIAKDGRRVFCKSPSCEAHNNGRGLGANQLRDLVLSRRAAA